MKAPLSLSSATTPSRARPSRRRTGASAVSSTATSVSRPGYSYASVADVPEDFFSQIWTPGLLDRLQAPLTRYRE